MKLNVIFPLDIVWNDDYDYDINYVSVLYL